MTITLIKTETKSQILFQEFLDGKTLPVSACNLVLQDLAKGDHGFGYEFILNIVKGKLTSGCLSTEENILFVKYNYTFPDEERPILIRLLNMKYGTNNFIVVNLKELVYVPAGSKNYNSGNELEEWLSNVTGKHLAQIKMSERKLKMKGYVDRVKNFFRPTKKAEVSKEY